MTINASLHLQYDVTILGGGFGGSLLSTMLAKSGKSVVLVDRGKHPRFAIGESSTPAADMILHSLALEYDLPELLPLCKYGTWREAHPQLRCGCKRGFSYFSHTSSSGFKPTLDHDHELLVAASASLDDSDTHWYRADVDQFFWQLAEGKGVNCIETATVDHIHHLRDQRWKLEVSRNDRHFTITTNFVVDATGAAGVLLKHLGVTDTSDELCTASAAIFSHFDHVPTVENWCRDQGAEQADFPYPADDSAVHHLFSDGWLWELRFTGGPTSVGFACSPLASWFDASQSANKNWASLLSHHPDLVEILGRATLSPIPGQLIQTTRLQRLAAQSAGSDWAVLPFTAGFIDPLHSTGIAHTLIGVQRLAKLLTTHKNSTFETQLKAYSAKLKREFRLIDMLVAGCYATLGDFEKFAAWSMLYFAAATTFEKEFRCGNDNFLCANDSRFFETVNSLYDELIGKFGAGKFSSKRFVRFVEQAIRPYNFVGLFKPTIRNMYRYTAAAK